VKARKVSRRLPLYRRAELNCGTALPYLHRCSTHSGTFPQSPPVPEHDSNIAQVINSLRVVTARLFHRVLLLPHQHLAAPFGELNRVINWLIRNTPRPLPLNRSSPSSGLGTAATSNPGLGRFETKADSRLIRPLRRPASSPSLTKASLTSCWFELENFPKTVLRQA
jgi:hypothetical protein